MTLPLNKKQKQLVEKSMDLVPIMIRSMTRTAAYVTEEEQQELCQIGYLALCRSAVGFEEGCPVARSDRKFDVPESAFDEAPGWRAFLLVSWFPDVPRHRNCRMDSGSRHKPVRHENAFHIQRMHLLILLFRRSKGSG